MYLWIILCAFAIIETDMTPYFRGPSEGSDLGLRFRVQLGLRLVVARECNTLVCVLMKIEVQRFVSVWVCVCVCVGGGGACIGEYIMLPQKNRVRRGDGMTGWRGEAGSDGVTGWRGEAGSDGVTGWRRGPEEETLFLRENTHTNTWTRMHDDLHENTLNMS